MYFKIFNQKHFNNEKRKKRIESDLTINISSGNHF